jgi:hypothetical protein
MDEIAFTLDNVETKLPDMGKGKAIEVRRFENYWSQIMFGHSQP